MGTDSTKAVRPWAIWLIAAGAMVLYLLVAVGSWRGFHVGMDLGIFDQALQGYSQGKAPLSLIKSQEPFNILGDHFSPVTILLAPLYRLWPDARVLLYAQAVLVAVGVALVGLFAVKRGLGRFSLVLEAAFALSYGVLSALVFDFHEIAFGLPLLIWALWALADDRIGLLAVASCSLLLVKEDMPFYVAGIALCLFFSGRRLVGVLFGAGSVAALGLLIYVVIPHFSYWGRYAYIGDDARGVQSLAGAVGEFFGHLASPTGVGFLAMLVVTCGLGLRSKIALVLLPTVVFRFFAHDAVYLGFRYHYGILITGVCFMALIDALSTWRTKQTLWRRRLLTGQAVALVVCSVLGLLASATVTRVAHVWTQGDLMAQERAVEQLIPDGAKVVADVFLIDHLIDRTQATVAFPWWYDETHLPLEGDYVFLDTATKGYDNEITPWVDDLIDDLVASGQYAIIGQSGDRFVVLQHT
jgi:uncharacterized membrane protein